MGALANRLAKSSAKVYTLDIERIPGTFTTQRRGLTISGDFWDLSQYRQMIGRIHADDVTSWPRTICLAWKRYERKRVEFASEWGDGYEEMLRKAWAVYDDADIIIGHNAKSFDTKKLKGEWALIGLPDPSSFKVFDTLAVARREFGFESNTLDSLCKRFGLVAKTDKYKIEVAKAAVAGDAKAQREIELYNKGDIPASEALADKFRGSSHTHPNMGLFMDEDDARVCSKCGSDDIIQIGRAHTNVTGFAEYRCQSCKGIIRPNHRKAHAAFRGVA